MYKTKYVGCTNCGGTVFVTTKTVNTEVEMMVIDGELKETIRIGLADQQPDNPYGYWLCVTCNRTWIKIPNYKEWEGEFKEHHIFCNFAHPDKDPNECKQCKRLYKKHPLTDIQEAGGIDAYVAKTYPKVILKGKPNET